MNKRVIQKLNMHQKHRGEKERERRSIKSAKLLTENIHSFPLSWKFKTFGVWDTRTLYNILLTCIVHTAKKKPQVKLYTHTLSKLKY